MVAIFTNRLLKRQDLVVNGDGEQTRDFIFVGDVVQANLLAGKALLAGKLALEHNFGYYNVGCGKETSVNDVVKALRAAWRETEQSRNGHREIRVTHAAVKPGEQRRSVIDPRKIKRDLGWQPQVSFEDGLIATIRSFLVKR